MRAAALGFLKSFRTYTASSMISPEKGSGVRTPSTLSPPFGRTARRLGAAALGLMLLAGCAATGSGPSDQHGTDFESGLPAVPPKLTENPAAAQNAAETGGERSGAASLDGDPERLIGLGSQGLFALLGEPELIRRESPAQVWQYQGTACVFDVVLYQRDGVESVTYIEARDSQGNKTAARSCFNDLLRARQLSAAG